MVFPWNNKSFALGLDIVICFHLIAWQVILWSAKLSWYGSERGYPENIWTFLCISHILYFSTILTCQGLSSTWLCCLHCYVNEPHRATNTTCNRGRKNCCCRDTRNFYYPFIEWWCICNVIVLQIWSSSDEERLRLMLLLVHFENNAVKKKVLESASIYYIETEIDGVKRDNGLEKKLRTNRMRSTKMGHGPRK